MSNKRNITDLNEVQDDEDEYYDEYDEAQEDELVERMREFDKEFEEGIEDKENAEEEEKATDTDIDKVSILWDTVYDKYLEYGVAKENYAWVLNVGDQSDEYDKLVQKRRNLMYWMKEYEESCQKEWSPWKNSSKLYGVH